MGTHLEPLLERTLYYFHIRHTDRDLGRKPKVAGWTVGTDLQVHGEWGEIRRKLDSLPTPTKMYNDSYKKIFNRGSVEIIAPQQVPFAVLKATGGDRGLSPNDEVLISLSKKGCSLVLCESKKRHDLQLAPDITEKGRLIVMFDRNGFIANEIDKSLQPGEIGVLFLGSLHNLGNDMVKRLEDLGIRVEEQNESQYTKLSPEEFLGQRGT